MLKIPDWQQRQWHQVPDMTTSPSHLFGDLLTQKKIVFKTARNKC